MLWKVADKADPPDVQSTNYEWDVTVNGEMLPVLLREPTAPEKLMDLISCDCRAEGNACSRNCGCAVNGRSCTSYCVCGAGDNCCNGLAQQTEYEDGNGQEEEDLGRVRDGDSKDEDRE